MSGESDFEDFDCIQPSLIQQIKIILDQYPDSGQILKELIQNAEDAKAKEVKFLYDHHSYGTEKLHTQDLAKFQGPALYAYNDAIFSTNDWKGVRMLSESIKKKDPTKVGRFGLGFKSVFHMTDLPSVISGDSVAIIDPEEKYFSDIAGKRSGRKWHLKNHQKNMQTIPDHFLPYQRVFGCSNESFERGSYEGTLFRLPLRQEASKLSNTIYSQEKMKGLLECFEKDAHLILLFLMNLERIEIYEREAHSSQPRKLFHVRISEHCLTEVRKAREEFSTKVQENVSALSGGYFPEVKQSYTLTIETVRYSNGVSNKAEHSFVITNLFSGSDVSVTMQELIRDASLSYMPWIGVALPIATQLKIEEDADDFEEPKGHLFCFLPLPLESKSLTGLPVHVNGFFALSQNRRHLKWPSADQDETIQPLTDKSLLWNKGLLQEVLPKAYAELILHVISCLSEEEPRQMMTTSDAYSAWPDVNKVDVKWKSILKPLFEILLQSKVLHTDTNGGGWCKVEEVLLDSLENGDQSMRRIVIDLLNRTGQKVVIAPAHVKTALQEFRTINYVTSKTLRESLKADPSFYSCLSHQDKILLLKFVLSDYKFTYLKGLELLPLSDKTFTTFRGRRDDPIYIDSVEHPKSLLPGLQGMFLDTELDDIVTDQLKNAVKKGYTQLCYFDKEAVKQHLRQTLPSDWLGSEDHVTYHPGIFNHPTIKWMKTLWKYFGRHFAQKASDLDAFIGLPLVPLSPLTKRVKVQLARIQRPSSLVFASFNGESIDESVCQVLEDLGITILKDIPRSIRYYPGLVPSFVNPPTPKGVLNAMRVIFKSPHKKNYLLQKMRGLPVDKVRSFRRFLSSMSSPLKELDFNLLLTLPLFERYPGSGGKESRIVSLTGVNIGAPLDGLPPVRVFTELLDLRDHSSSVLADLLDIKPMSHNDLLKIMLDDALKNKYCPNELDKLVKYTLDRFGIFDGEDFKSIKQKLRCLSFVLTSGNSRKKPSELYDPEKVILKQVFFGEDVFPEEKSYYSRPDVLSHLRKLGLRRTESVTANDILMSAGLQQAIKYKGKVSSKEKVKFQAILKLLEQNPSLLEEKVKLGKIRLKECLCSIPWIPVLMEKPATYPTHLPLKQIANGHFACPKDVTSHEFINLVGSVKLLVDARLVSRVSKCFDWDKQPLFQDVISHLYNVIETFQENNDLDEQRTREVLEKIYEYFQIALKDRRDEVRKRLSPLDFILVGKQLFPAKKLALSSNVIYPPYLSQLPDCYKKSFGELFETLGVRKSFEIQDYIETLQMVKNKYGKSPVTEDLAQVKCVLNLLAEVMVNGGVSAKEAIDEYGSIFILDSDEIMKPSTDVCVKDCYWMPSEPDFSYINEGVSPQSCITLGAKTIRQKTLRQHVTPIGIPFGQKEKLTNRLKRILTGYPCDESFLKELLQNADDAKATKVCFINDPRQHRDKRVFEECWKPLQGPALCVYNNAPFTKSDIEGIQNLGEGSKGDDPNKTGQYGVGFNAVYHLTDAPTFMSQGDEIGEVMCVFDPNLKFIPDADASNPGMMCTDLPTLRKKFPDVFPCYDLDQYCPLTNATMFRLPLRNKEMASTSKISNKAMTTKNLEKLLDDFENELFQVLLFVNNVNEVSICEIDKETGNMTEKYSVKATLSEEDKENRRDFAARVSEIGKCLQDGEISISDVTLHQVSYVVNLEDREGLTQRWFVVQKIGFENPKEIPDAVIKAFQKGDLGLLPRGGVASLISSSIENPPGKAFCFLPLPFETGLPVHINGHFALNHEDRRSLWRNDRGNDYRSNWNDALLRRVVAPCYVTLLDEVRQHISLPRNANGKTFINGDRNIGECVLSNYFKYFPSFAVKEQYWKTLTREVYRYMNAGSLRLLPVLRESFEGNQHQDSVCIEWLPPKGHGRNRAFFGSLLDKLPSNYDTLDKEMKIKAVKDSKRLRDTLLVLGINLLFTPDAIDVYDCFITASVDVSLITPKDVIHFFSTYNSSDQLCDVGNLPLPISKTPFGNMGNLLRILKYCKQDEDFFQTLNGLPLLLTEDEHLRVFSQSHKVFLSGYCEILPSCSSMFVHQKLFIDVFYCHREVKPIMSPVFIAFDIKAFASLLPKEMEVNHYRTTGSAVIWNPEKKTHQIPIIHWIRHVWRFFSNYIEKEIKSYDEEQSRTRKFPEKCIEKMKVQQFFEVQDKEERRRITQKALEPVKEWCLLPAFETNPGSVKHILLPIGMSYTVIDLESSFGFELKETLKKIILPQLNCNLIDGESRSRYSMAPSKTAKRLVASLEDPKSVLTVLLKKMSFDPKSFKAFGAVDCLHVLGYFDTHLTKLQPSTAEELKWLPLYETIHDDIISISGKQAYVLSSRIPKDDMHIWQETSRIVFLKESKSLEKLYEFLQCHSKDEVDVYCDIIFKKFEDMSKDARIKHVIFVRELLYELERRILISSDEKIKKKAKLTKLSQALLEMKFMADQDGILKTASSFCDPLNKVFAAMFKHNQEMFPPEPFCEAEWLPFLRRIGLIHEITDEQFLKFAKQIETEDKTKLDDGTRKKSEALITYLFQSENIATSELLDHVKDICFLFPDNVEPCLQAIHDQYGSGKTGSPCICFQGSVASTNHSITWTTASLLPDYANLLHCTNVSFTKQEQNEIVRRLSILQNPSVDMVVTHCKNICSALCQMNCTENSPGKRSKRGLQKVVRIMTSIYEYLENNYNGNEEVINELKNIRCIVVEDGERFVFPNQVAVDITSDQEIPPYLYKIFGEVAAYAELFEKLGTTNTITAAQYSMVLKNIHDECGDEKLHPNEIRNAFKATKGFFETFKVEDTEIKPLYLPGVKHNPSDHSINMVFLRPSAEILYNDAPHLKERISEFKELILVKLADCELEVNNEDRLVKKLPESIRPRMLTSVVRETLVEENQALSCSSTAQNLRQVLISCEFCHGMIRLIKHADYKNDVETSTDIPALVQERLRCIRVCSVPNLRTKLVCNGRAIPGSEADVSCFEEETVEEGETVWKIYIEKEADLSKFVSVVAEIIDRITGHLLKPVLVHLPTLLSSKPYEIKGLLDGLKIREDNSSKITSLPTPGSFIHITDHHLLVDDFTVFSPGEYVGYELDDPSLRGEEGIPTYIYAIVIEEVINDGQPSSTEPSLRKYRIDIGKDTELVVVDAADLYKFYRPSRQGNSGSRDEKSANLDEIRKEIKRILQEAWKQPVDKRRKIIKRLYLKWQPNKNPGNETFCRVIFEFILAEIERMKQEYKTEGFDSNFGAWNNRAQRLGSQRSSFNCDGGFSTFSPGSYRRNPQPGEARRWYNQAKEDLEAASNDVQYQRTSYEWACFKCHQSAEKVLKAAQYLIDADKTNVHDLTMIAHDLNNDNLSRLASELESLVGDSTRMRYPDRVRYPNIPHDVYTSSMASKAIDLALAIVQEVESKFIHRAG